ncbi:FAD-dependent oxidoreductase [Bacillus sp. Marseille-P3661]|uniref:FAD-dependent oxidoreductase n=1 Tax=Bacillus sp. Marseille-P3661 TaxID=1936234 RepID=UPI000C8670A8|nr:FAD-dependent oxidoreductase [Bacillus sp. Marseille-P3661]
MESIKDQNTLHYDVIVVGAGGAGLTAALTAAQSGAKTAVLEKNPEVGGTTRMAIGSLTAAGTSIQKRDGIKDSIEHFKEDMKKFIGPLHERDNEELRDIIADEAANTVEWMKKLGVSFVGPFGEPPNRVPRMHNGVPTARVYITALHKHAKNAGVDILVNTRVIKLLKNETGAIEGVIVQKDGSELTIHAKRGVILSTGDYSNSPELKAKYMRPEAAEVEGINLASTGDGHKMGVEVGGELKNMDVAFGPQLRLLPPPKPPLLDRLPSNLLLNRVLANLQRYSPPVILSYLAKQMLTVRTSPSPKLFEQGAILVNSEGNRFTNEIVKPEYDVAKQSNGNAYIILDERIAQKFSSGEYFISTAPGIAYAYWKDYEKSRPDLISSGKTLTELATSLGIPIHNLDKAVNQYNNSADAAIRGTLKPPFYSLGPVNAAFTSMEGGLNINRHCQVLNKDQIPINGLYAAGSVGSGGLILAGHGLHIMWALISGRIAGEHITKE